MSAFAKGLAMANPKHVSACVAAAATVIYGNFGSHSHNDIHDVSNKIDYTDIENLEKIKRKNDELTEEEIDHR